METWSFRKLVFVFPQEETGNEEKETKLKMIVESVDKLYETGENDFALIDHCDYFVTEAEFWRDTNYDLVVYEGVTASSNHGNVPSATC